MNTENPNEYIEQFLEDYYAFNKSPEYAVLIKGKWGVGKTWFIKRTLNSLKNKDGNFLYVSLYGIHDTREIENEFFKQLHPLLSSKTMGLVGKIAKGLLKTTIKVDLDNDGKADTSVSSQTPDIELPEYLTKTEDFVLVFDDLERCPIKIGNILGYINHFVEHQGYKVVILANEEEIFKEDEKNEETYRRIKEKLIGKTFEITPDFDGALIHFIEQVDCSYVKKIYLKNTQVIRDLYDSSAYENLRHLKQSLWDFERLCLHLTEKIKENEELIVHLLKLYLCYSFEIKSGNILPQDIKLLKSSYLSSPMPKENKEKDKTPYDRVSEKYKNISFHDSLIEESLWIEIFDRGYIDSVSIEESLLKSNYFKEDNTPTWIKLWHYMDLSGDDFLKYIEIVQTEFQEFKFDDIGVVKHLVGLFMWFADINIHNKTKDEVLTFSKKYIDHLKSKNCLIRTNTRFTKHLENESWGGLTFCGKDLDEFKEFLSYLNQKSNEAVLESYPDAGRDLLRLMETDIDKFYRRLALNNHEDNIYYEIPILSHIKPDEFISVFMNISSDNKRTVCHALGGRYESNNFNAELSPELDWLNYVKEKLLEQKQSLNGTIAGYILGDFIKNCLDKAISNLDNNR